MRECPTIRCNAVIDVTMTEDRPPIQAEPVSLIETKKYLKVGYEEDDQLISLLIMEARQWVENRCGISIINKTVTSLLHVLNRQELPYGPIQKTTIEVIDHNGDVVTSPVLDGLDNGFISLVGYGQFQATYKTGYSICPPELKIAIMAKVANSYEHRGDELEETNSYYAKLARQKSNMYKRTIGF